MISMLGILAAEVATGKDAIEQFGLFAVAGRTRRCSSSSSSFAGSTTRRPRAVQSRVSAAVAPVDEEAPPPPPFNPAEQVGAMAPLGFFDPLGFTKVGDQEGFSKLRA